MPERECRCGCGQTFVPHHRAGRGHHYATQACRNRANRRIRAKRGARGRVCVCGATDRECYWGETARLCGACERAAARNGYCPACRGPLRTLSGNRPKHCPRCESAPKGLVPVTVINDEDDREKTVYRRVVSFVCVGAKQVSLGAVVSLPLKEWLRLRA